MTKYATKTPIALSPDEAAASLNISRSTLEKFVKDRLFSPPVKIPGHRLVRYDWERLRADWAALRDRSENEEDNEWDTILPGREAATQ